MLTPPEAAPPGTASSPALWIELDPASARATVHPARTGGAVLAHTLVLRPGEEYRGIGFQAWREHAGRTVDVLPARSGSRSSPPRLVPLCRDFHGAVDKAMQEARDRAAGPPLPALPREERPDELPAWNRSDGAPAYDWRGDVAFELHGDPPEGSEYGCHYAGVNVPCWRDELAQWCAAFPTIATVWTPETRGFARPEEIPFLVEAYRAHALRSSRRKVLRSSLVFAGSLAALTALVPGWPRTLLVLVPAFSAVSLLAGAYELREARSAGPHVFAQHRAAQFHRFWVYQHRRTQNLWILGCLAAVMMVRMAGGDAAIAAAGLVKPAVWQGQAWRLLTGPLLHVGVLHILMNASAIYVIGPFIEVHARRGILPLVFLVSALGGSLLSLLLLPDTTSVGASGGIMGMFGFLGVFALRNGDQLPPRFFSQEVALSVAGTAVFGLVGIEMVDNAAHLGGLLTGALLGCFLAEPPRNPEPWTRWAGRIALAVTFAGAALAIYLMLAAS